MNTVSSYIIRGFIALVSLTLVSRLYYLQAVDVKFKKVAYKSSFKKKTEYSHRGVIYDRRGKLIVANEPIFDLVVTVSKAKGVDTLALCKVLSISSKQFLEYSVEMRKRRDYSYVKPIPFIKQFSQEEYAVIQDRFRFIGFEFVPRIGRVYPHKSMANTLGYIAEISARELDIKSGYIAGDYIGKTGIEKTYETELRGKIGLRHVKVSARGIEMGAFMEGQFDTLPQPGFNLVASIDLELQQYGELLMGGKIGSIVAIEPSTGEILSLISAPSYDPNVLKGRAYSDNFSVLAKDTLKPLFDRTCQAGYPPGSIFKLVQAAIAMQEGIITPTEKTYVRPYPNMGDHAPIGVYDIKRAIKLSSNWYFSFLYKKMLQRNVFKNDYKDTEYGFKIWAKYLNNFGLGHRLGSDISHEKGGQIPSVKFYNRWYGGAHRWKSSTIISNAIGQGELLVVPLQMANIAAIIANKGYYYTPHTIKEIKGDTSDVLAPYHVKHQTGVRSIYFEPIIDGMQQVVESGTARRAITKDIVVCGKTGTAENPHGEDHSVFVAFAPRENPKIAIAVYVENAGYGGTWAAPIASLMIEKYIKREISNKYKEQRILEKKFVE